MPHDGGHGQSAAERKQADPGKRYEEIPACGPCGGYFFGTDIFIRSIHEGDPFTAQKTYGVSVGRYSRAPGPGQVEE